MSVMISAQDFSYIPFVQKKVGDSLFTEHAIMSAVHEVLDGPAREAMTNGVSSVDSDTAGNIYFCDHRTCNIRVMRRSDRRVFTITGSSAVTNGVALASGPAHRLHVGEQAMIDLHRLHAFGDPLSGNGALYFWDPVKKMALKIYKNNSMSGMWWYEKIAGGGSSAPTDGAVATQCDFNKGMMEVLEDGTVVMMKSGQFYKLQQDGTMQALIRQSLLDSINSNAGQRRSWGINKAGVFCVTTGTGYAGGNMWLISPNGDSLLRYIVPPYDYNWGVYSDIKRDCWYVKGMDDYSINRMNRLDTNVYSMMSTGNWSLTNKKNPSGALGGERGMPMRDGRYASWTGHGSSPIFIHYFLDSVANAVLIKEQSRATTVNEGSDSYQYGWQADFQMSAFPNPFIGSTVLDYLIPEAGAVKLQIFSVSGRLVYEINNPKTAAGRYRVRLNSRSFSNQSTGLYFVRLTLGTRNITTRLFKY